MPHPVLLVTREPARSRQQTFDAWFPTIVRYAGLALTVVLVVFTIRGNGVDLAAGYVAAAGMILYKSVHDAVRNGGNGK